MINGIEKKISLVAQTVKHLPIMQETQVRKILWRRKWQPTPVLFPGKSHGWQILAGYSLWGLKELDTTERLHLTLPNGIEKLNKLIFLPPHGERNGTPLQYSCLENPMDGGAWKAAVHGVAEGRIPVSDFTLSSHFHALEKEMATHSSVLAWRIPGTGEPSGLPSTGSHRVGHDWHDLAAAYSDIFFSLNSENDTTLSVD